MNKAHILSEIARTAALNAGTPLGVDRFFNETGIRASDWHGKYWSRWGDALQEAGFSPNVMQEAIPEGDLLSKLALFCRELGKFPVRGEFRLKHRADPGFPSSNVFDRFGTKAQLIAKLSEYCLARTDLGDVALICAAATKSEPPDDPEEDSAAKEPPIGFVYLIKYGRHYKIGRTNAAGRRERELAIQLPDKTSMVHTIRTDDPAGIEAYWHERFAAKRQNGEWFALAPEDLKAFKRRRFM